MRKILVVDDEIDVCDFVKHFFEERNFLVLTALNGTEAIRLVRKENPDIILLDVRMNGIDGIETLRRIKEVNKKAKVIMVTAIDDSEKISVASKLGAVHYVTKPLVLEELESVVASYSKEVKNA